MAYIIKKYSVILQNQKHTIIRRIWLLPENWCCRVPCPRRKLRATRSLLADNHPESYVSRSDENTTLSSLSSPVPASRTSSQAYRRKSQGLRHGKALRNHTENILRRRKRRTHRTENHYSCVQRIFLYPI